MFRHFVVKIFNASLHARFWHKRIVGNIIHFQVFTDFAGQYHYFAHHIGATQIQPWIGFGITFILRIA